MPGGGERKSRAARKNSGNQTAISASMTRARVGDIVSKVRDYQHRASECVRLALAARDQTNKLLLLDMAQCWLTLSEQALAEENAVSAKSAKSAERAGSE
jgi:hypothetical protein